MSHFVGTFQGNKEQVSCTGSAKSGIFATVQGYRFGVSVEGRKHDDGTDTFHVRMISGINGSRPEKYVGKATLREDGELVWVPPDPEPNSPIVNLAPSENIEEVTFGWNSGGGILLDIIVLQDGRRLVISDDCVCLYAKDDEELQEALATIELAIPL